MRAVYEANLVEDTDYLELPIYDAECDARGTRCQPCLSHLSFKLLPRDRVLTVLYRYHYYIEKALGNLLGLAQLLYFVAEETGLGIGPLVCHSTYAVLDTEGGWRRGDVRQLAADCQKPWKKVPRRRSNGLKNGGLSLIAEKFPLPNRTAALTVPPCALD